MSFIKAVRYEDDPKPTQDVLPPIRGQWEATAYAVAALNAECEQIRNAQNGTRNDTLNRAAFNMAQLIAGGQISAEHVQGELVNAARAAGLPDAEVARTIRSGFAKGQQRARTKTPDTPTPPLPHVGVSGPATDEPSPWTHLDPEQARAVQEHPPEHLQREDGTSLFYPGKVNGLLGESESGKTWIALLAVTQALQAGHNVLYLDFEDTYSGIAGRLTSMHAPLDRFYYTAPDVGLDDHHRAALAADLELIHPALIILDGFNAAMTLLGLDLNSNTDATTFAQTLLRPLAKTGACVVYVDHLPKHREFQGKGGIGAQAKRAMTTGCAIRVDVEQEFGKGQTGRLKLTVDKDRPGLVRAIASAGKHLGHAVLTSSPLGDAVSMTIDPDGGAKPTILMGRVLDYLDVVGSATKSQIRNNVEGNNDHVYRAIQALENEGKVDIVPGKNRSLLVTRAVDPSDDYRSRDHGPTVPPRIKGGTVPDPHDPDQAEDWWKR